MRANPENISCPSCEGTGACPHCGGKGTIGLNIYVETYARESPGNICSFCRKKVDEAKQLFAGETGVMICSDCIEFINDLMEDVQE